MRLFGKRKSKIEIVGVYTVKRKPDVKLRECIIDCPPLHVDVSKFIHPLNNTPKLHWQAAYDEHYLNENGTEVIGGFCDIPTEDTMFTRLAFFIHFVNFDNPLLSQFGKLRLPPESSMPKRLKNLIKYVPVD